MAILPLWAYSPAIRLNAEFEPPTTYDPGSRASLGRDDETQSEQRRHLLAGSAKFA